MRQFSPIDNLLISANKTLGKWANSGQKHRSEVLRANPAQDVQESVLSSEEKRHVAGLMRVNHAGEVAAQALYAAQGLAARDPELIDAMKQAAKEEEDHLDWCKSRVEELGSHVSYLDPVWSAGAFAIGLGAAALGDKWNLGFLAETEHQVVEHLQAHLDKLPEKDEKSRSIVKQMQQDEAEHAHMAEESGAKELPQAVKTMMKYSSKVMTKTAYWI